MELTLDLYVRRDVNDVVGDKGFSDIMHETIDENDLLEFMQERMKYKYGAFVPNIVVDSVTVTHIKP